MKNKPDLFETKLAISVRPLRLAYFFRDDDAASLARIAAFTCSQWGGIFNLVIPVSSDFELKSPFVRLLHIYPPDRVIFYGAAENDEENVAAKVLAVLRRMYPSRHFQVFFGPRWEEYDHSAHALSFTQPGAETKSEVLVHEPVAGCDPLPVAIVFGAMPDGQRDDYERHFTLKSSQVDLSQPSIWEAQNQLAENASLINLTAHGVIPHRVKGWMQGPGFDVIISSSCVGLAAFWNFRAIREVSSFDKLDRRTILVPSSAFTEVSHADSLLAMVRSSAWRAGVSGSVDVVFTCERKEDTERVKMLLKNTPRCSEFQGNQLSVSISHGKKSQAPRESDSERDVLYTFYQPSLPDDICAGFGPPALPSRVVLREGTNDVLHESPEGLNGTYLGEHVREFESEMFLRSPISDAVAKKWLGNGWFSGSRLSASYEGNSKREYLTLSVPSGRDIWNAYFAAHDLDSRLSPSARYGAAVIALLGGLDAVKSIASKLAFRLTNQLAQRSSKKVAQYVIKMLKLKDLDEDAIAKVVAEAEVAQELARVVKTAEQLAQSLEASQRDVLSVLSPLTDAGLVRRGFFIHCPNCQTPAWYPLESLSERLDCVGCSHRFPLPVERSVGLEMRWEYTLNTLGNRAVDQDTIVPILTAYRLSRDKALSNLELGVELLPKGKDNVTAEFDLLAVAENTPICAECKAGTELTDKDFNTARFASKLGISTYYFATVQHFSAKTVEAIERFNEELINDGKHMKVVVLQEKDLLT